MSLVLINDSTLTDIADAIRKQTYSSTKYTPAKMPAEIKKIGKPLFPFSTATDEQLVAMLNAYYTGKITLNDVKSVWKVGDKRKISLSAMSATYVTESHVAQEQNIVILDFDHDTLTNQINGVEKALISVLQERVLSNGTTIEKGKMNSSNTNSNGWGSTPRRSWCNNVYYNALPSGIKSLVKQVSKPYYSAKNILTNVNDYIWLCSGYEVFNSTSYLYGAEGTFYPLFTSSSYRIKYIGDTSNTGKTNAWRLRSIHNGSPTYCFTTCEPSGNRGQAYASAPSGIAPAFCL